MKQPWLHHARTESLLILAPSLLPVAIVILFQDYFIHHTVSDFWWVVLVLVIDVGHVYSTLFRLYWDRPTFLQYKRTLILIPVIAFGAGILIHIYSGALFWRLLAYIAVYHFVRQQYGFMRLYSRKENQTSTQRWIDITAIYMATLYPLCYWHLHLTKELSWFVPGDFISVSNSAVIDQVLLTLYVLSIVFYLIKELLFTLKYGINLPKNLIIVGTYLSWYTGIVMFQGDLIFTMLNVVAHGIPYMGLIWIYGERKDVTHFSFTLKGVAIFCGILILLAYLEEGLWDILVWKDHQAIFPFMQSLAPLDNPYVLSIIVPLLVLPQITHYVLDGFIWRFSKGH